MKLKFSLRRPGGEVADLIATLDSGATVGDLAEHLAAADPSGARRDLGDRPTLTLVEHGNQLLDPDVLVGDAGISSGAQVSLGSAGSTYDDRTAAPAAVRVDVVAGPDAGKRFDLPLGSTTIGRDAACDVTLGDPQVSRRHLRLNLTDVVEVIDLGSANGVRVGGQDVARTTLRPGDLVEAGETTFAVTLLAPSANVAGTAAFAFNRSPIVQPVYDGIELHAPEVPERIRPQRFPVIALIAPLLMGAVLFAVNSGSGTARWTSLVFVALSPLMLIGNALESRFAARKDFKAAVAAFEEDLELVRGELEEAASLEVVRRRQENPGGADAIVAADERLPLLWSRRPGERGWLEINLGLGDLTSRNRVEYPRAGRAPKSLARRSREVLEPHLRVHPVPVVANLAAGPVGIVGPRTTRLGACRAAVQQVASLHAPSEVVVAAFLTAPTASDWDWLKWLPHTTSPQSPLAVRHLAATQGAATALLLELEHLVDLRAAQDGPAPIPAVVVIVEDDAAAGDRPRLVALAERGATYGVHVLWFAAAQEALPAACKTFALTDPAGGPGVVGYVHDGATVTPVVLDEAGPTDVAAAARALSPLFDAGALVADDSDLPTSVSQLTLLGADVVETPAAVVERWQQNNSILSGPAAPEKLARRAASLRAVVGQSSSGQHAIDLRVDGPHALVGGTTGAGKSELLQSWILAMAAAHSPQRVTFLLVDYKGGSAFAECDQLPHSIGMVTDLNQHLVRRALTSLRAELKYREELLKEHDAKDLQAMEKQGLAMAPPSLVIVVDEFAALAGEVPEFVEGMVDVGQRGRSLGIHLILATQRPAGVIKENLRANTNLRVALRMAMEADSTDILGSPVAAHVDPSLAGRAMSRSGPGRMVPFQTAYAGGWTSNERERPDIVVEQLDLTNPAPWQLPAAEPVVRDKEQTDIKRLVRNIREANRMAALPAPRKAWLPVLGNTQSLARVHRSASDAFLGFAVADDPERQAQPVAHFEPDRDGNLVVYGTGGSGKSTLLRTLGIAAGLSTRGGPCFVYGLDFGSRGLAMLQVLPHVGSIVSGNDHERLVRLLSWIRAEIDERAARFSDVNAGTISQYREVANRPQEPRILLLVDGVAAFRTAYEGSDRIKWLEMLTSIASEGRPVGVHVVLSAENRSALSTALGSAVQRRLVLRMVDNDDYGTLGVPNDVLTPASVPGRGILDDLEVQVAVLGGTSDPVVQAAEVASLAKAMRDADRPVAPPIRSLATEVAFSELPQTRGDVVVGIGSDELEPFATTAQGPFLLVGPPRSGRTSALRTFVASYQAAYPHAELHYFGNRRSSVAGLPDWASTSFTAEEVSEAAAKIADRIEGGAAPVAVFVESAGDLVNSNAEMALQRLARACAAEEQWLVVEGETSTLSNTTGFLGLVKASRTGFALQPDPENGAGLFKTPFGRVTRADFPLGRGLAVYGGRTQVVQLAQPPG